MGRSLIGLDSVVFIYTWNKHPEFLNPATILLKQVQDGRSPAVFAEIGIIELITGIKKFDRYDMVIQYSEKISNFPNLFVTPLNTNSIDIASSLRAKYNLSTPDAIHLATSIDAGATKFYTNDKQLKKVKEIEVITLG